MKNIFQAQQVPYFLTLLIAIIGFQVNYLIDSIVNIPAVEYYFEKNVIKSDDGTEYYNLNCMVTNLSRKTAFDSLSISLRYKNDYEFTHVELIPVPPASRSGLKESLIDKKYAKYTIVKLQPGSVYELNATVKARKEGSFIFPLLYLATEDTLKMKKRSFSTWISKNQLFINFIIILFWIVIVVIYFKILNKTKSYETEKT